MAREARVLGIPPPDPRITPRRIAGSFSFDNAKDDTVTLVGDISLPAELDLSQEHEFSVAIGNVVADLNIDKIGRLIPGRSDPLVKSFRIQYLRVKPGTVTKGGELGRVLVKMSANNLVAAGFDTEGITSDSTDAFPGKVARRQLQVAFLLEGVAYETLFPVNFQIKPNKKSGIVTTVRAK